MSKMKLLSKNMLFTVGYQFLFVVTTFVIRKCFISFLGVEMLGVNSVYTNLLSALNLAELGIGSAITSHLYKPLYENDVDQINVLMSVFKKLYNILGIVVFVVGIVVSFKVSLFFPAISIDSFFLQILFLLDLVGTTSTYFLAYYRTLLIADQKNIFISFSDSIVQLCIAVLQIICLFYLKSFTIFLILNVFKNIISNILIRLYVKKNYSLKFVKLNKKNKKVFKQILDYVKDVSIAKIGAYIYYGTDNLIISFFKGAILTGLISNYTLITTTLKNLITAFLNPVQATLGALFVRETDAKKRFEVFRVYWQFILIISLIVCVEIVCLSDDFIILFFGESYVISKSTLYLLGINLFMTILLILPSQLFVIFRLYQYDKIIVSISAVLNILISICLIQIIGVDGVFIGTFITSIVYLLSRLYIIARKVLFMNFYKIMKLIIKSFTFIIIVTLIVIKVSHFISVSNIFILIGKAFLILILLCLFSLLLIFDKKNRMFLIRLIRR